MTLDIIERAQSRIAQNNSEIEMRLADNVRWQDFIAQALELAGEQLSQSGELQTEGDDTASSAETVQNPVAKASKDSGTTEQDIELPADSVTGDVSRLAAGRTADVSGDEIPASNAGQQGDEQPESVTAGETAPDPVAGKPVEAPASSAPSGDAQFRSPEDWEDEDSAQPAFETAKPVTLIDPIAEDVTRQGRIRELHERQPTWPAKLIAEALGMTTPTVVALGKRYNIDLPTQAQFEASRVARTTETLKAAVQHVQPVIDIPALPAARPTAKPAKGQLFRLRTGNREGKYLHQSCIGLVDDQAYAWKGTERQMAAVRARYKEALDLYEEPVL